MPVQHCEGTIEVKDERAWLPTGYGGLARLGRGRVTSGAVLFSHLFSFSDCFWHTCVPALGSSPAGAGG